MRARNKKKIHIDEFLSAQFIATSLDHGTTFIRIPIACACTKAVAREQLLSGGLSFSAMKKNNNN